MKKGFTLIELLAVIVLLAIILVIAVPRIMSVINNAKREAFKSSVNLIASSIQHEVTAGNITEDGNCKTGVPAAVTAAVRYNPADFETCTYTITNGEVKVTATGAASGKFGAQDSFISTR